MTEPRRRRPSPFPVAAGSVAAFLVLFSLLAFQLRSGRDPALGGVTPQAAIAKRVLVKRIERRVVVTRLVPRTPTPSAVASAPSGAAGPAPAPASPAPQAVSPAPVAAPAPAPAPVVTRSS